MLHSSFAEDLDDAVAYHGHLCAGQILGVRIARRGCIELGVENPHTYRDLIAFVEADRCVADAVSTVTGCQLGRRRLKWFDYGKMAASFFDLPTGRAVRVVVGLRAMTPPGDDPVQFLSQFDDKELLRVMDVDIRLTPNDLPGKPLVTAICDTCGERVMDGRHIVNSSGEVLCKACSGEPVYYLSPRLQT